MKEKYCDDYEGCHSLMDDLLCETLESLGYEDGIKIYEDFPKYYS